MSPYTKFLGLVILVFTSLSAAAQDKPNILVIWGDDIGWSNVSAYNRGMMGYETPNIDSIANAGILFTDAYGQNSCTAGRAAFITGQSPFRTGLLKVGLPGAKEGITGKRPRPLLIFSSQWVMCQASSARIISVIAMSILPTNHGFR